MKRFGFIWMALIVAVFAVQGQEVSAVLEHDQIKIGEQLTIELEVRFPAATETVMMPELQDTITEFVEVVKVSNIDTTFDEDDITIKIFNQKITITSWDSGFHVIPPFKFTIGDKVFSTEPLLLTVNTIAVQAEQDIKDIKNIIEVPFSLTDWLLANKKPIGITAMILLLLAILILVIVKLTKGKKGELHFNVPKEAADVIAIRKLEELKEKQLWQNKNVKEYYSEISFIIREYIENRFQLRALEQTTDEIILLTSQHDDIDKELNQKLEALLFLADMAKFAKQQPQPSQNEDAFKDALIFVESTIEKEEVKAEENSDQKTEENA